jgi:hypothetical protein
MPKDIIANPDDKLLSDLKSRFLRAKRGEKKWRVEKDLCEKFYDGEQWSTEEKKILKERNQPEVVINRIKPKIDSIVGLELKMAVDTKAFELRSRDFKKAEYISEAFRFIEKCTNFDEQESVAFKDQIRCGRGWYKTSVRWTGFDAEIITERVNPSDVFLDPYCRRMDLMDAKDISESIWQDAEDTKSLFPQFENRIDQVFFDSGAGAGWKSDKQTEAKGDQYKQGGDETDNLDLKEFVQKDKKRLRVVSTYYREPVQKKFFFDPTVQMLEDVTEASKSDLEKIKKAFPNAQEFLEIRYKLNVATYIWNQILEQKLDIKPRDRFGRFDFVLVPGIAFESQDLQGQYQGMVSQMIDLQREINMRRSKMLHLLNTNRARFEKGAFDDPTAARKEWAKADGWLEQNPQFQFVADSNVQIAESQFQLLQEAKSEIDNTGVRGEIEGLSKASSGRDFMLRHEAATQMLAPYLYNLRSARRQVAQRWLYYIQGLWTSPRTFSLSDDQEAPPIEINKVDPLTGQKINDVTVGEYDVVIEEAPETLNLRSEDFDKLLKMAQTGIAVPPELLVELSSLSAVQKQKILQSIDAQKQAQAQMMQMQMLQAQQAGTQPVPGGVR